MSELIRPKLNQLDGASGAGANMPHQSFHDFTVSDSIMYNRMLKDKHIEELRFDDDNQMTVLKRGDLVTREHYKWAKFKGYPIGDREWHMAGRVDVNSQGEVGSLRLMGEDYADIQWVHFGERAGEALKYQFRLGTGLDIEVGYDSDGNVTQMRNAYGMGGHTWSVDRDYLRAGKSARIEPWDIRTLDISETPDGISLVQTDKGWTYKGPENPTVSELIDPKNKKRWTKVRTYRLATKIDISKLMELFDPRLLADPYKAPAEVDDKWMTADLRRIFGIEEVVDDADLLRAPDLEDYLDQLRPF